jgi:hypothetical protein
MHRMHACTKACIVCKDGGPWHKSSGWAFKRGTVFALVKPVHLVEQSEGCIHTPCTLGKSFAMVGKLSSRDLYRDRHAMRTWSNPSIWLSSSMRMRSGLRQPAGECVRVCVRACSISLNSKALKDAMVEWVAALTSASPTEVCACVRWWCRKPDAAHVRRTGGSFVEARATTQRYDEFV